MTAILPERTNLDLAGVTSEATTDDEVRPYGSLSASEVIEKVAEILGYDPVEEALMIEGYRELGDEVFSISESTLRAQAETLPPE